MKTSKNKITNQYLAQGFTLLEVLISLTIFAVTSIALLSQSSQSVSQSIYLEEKAYALWIAQNTLTELRLNDQWPNLGQEQSYQNLFDREWIVKVNVSTAGEPSLRYVEVNIYRSENESSLSHLQSYIGEY